MHSHDICFVGLENLPVLAREYNAHGVGGEQVQQTLLSRAMVRRGHRVAMVVLDYGQLDGEQWDGVTTYKAYRPGAGLPGLRFVHPRWTAMWNALRRADARTYYVSCAGMRVGLAAMFCRRHGRRLVFRTAHDNDCLPDKVLVEYARDRRLYEYGIRRADAILTQSDRQQRDLLANYGLGSEVAGMLVEAPIRPTAYEERDLDVLWVNNLLGFKRPDLLLELARRMPERRFAMIGGPAPGSPEPFATIQREAASCPNLSFLGRIPYHDVNDYYARAKVFVNTSDTEGFPNSYLQAWIRGTPLVAFFDPDGVIDRERLGTAPASLDAMVAAVDHLLTDQELWQATSSRAQAFMAREFDEATILQPYLKSCGLA